MSCFLACFGGGDGDRRRRRRKSRRQSPVRSPPRPDHVSLVGNGKASVAADVVLKEASPPLPEVNALPPPMEVAEEVVASAGPDMELRELSEQKTSPARSLPSEKQVTPPTFPVKCSPVVAAVVCTPDLELREVSEQESRGSGKKKVMFDMNVTTYENTTLLDQEEEPPEPVKKMLDEDEKHMQKAVVLPENHRYRNCPDNDDEDEDEYGEDDNYGDGSDEEEDFVDCKIDLVDDEEMNTEEDKHESQESLFSLPMSKDQANEQEVSSPAPKSSGTSVEEESPLIQGNNPRDRSQFVRPVLNPVHNLSQWKEVKVQAAPIKKMDKENVNSVPDAGASPGSKLATQKKISPDDSIQREVSVDASLSTWLVSSDNSTVDKAQSKSPRSMSSVSREERPVLGALTADDLKQSSSTSSLRRSPSHKREAAPILGTVGSYWSCTKQDNAYCSSRPDSGTNGVPNTTSKYREDRRVNWHSTPFNVRLDRALNNSSA